MLASLNTRPPPLFSHPSRLRTESALPSMAMIHAMLLSPSSPSRWTLLSAASSERATQSITQGVHLCPLLRCSDIPFHFRTRQDDDVLLRDAEHGRIRLCHQTSRALSRAACRSSSWHSAQISFLSAGRQWSLSCC